MTLRFQILLSVAVALVLSLALGGTVAWWNAESSVDTELESALSAGARVARNAIDHLPSDASPHYVEHLVAAFDGNRHVKASLMNGNGHIVASSTPDPGSVSTPAWFKNLIGAESLRLKMELPDEVAPYQSLLLVADPRNEVSEVWLRLRDDIAIMTGLCFVTFVLVYLIVGRGLKPLQALATGLGTIGRGGYDARVRTEGTSDIRSIAGSFNRMAEQLEYLEVRNNALRSQLLMIQEEERADLARDLHDEVGPFLFSVNVDAATIGQNIPEADRTRILPYVNSIKSAVAHMQRHVRAILERLRPPSLVDVGLQQAIENLSTFWRRIHPHLQIQAALQIPNDGFGDSRDEAIYRFVQEAMNNAVRHGRADTIDISVLEEAGEIRVAVNDGGGGLPQAQGGGYGLIGMRERMAALGGVVTIADRVGTRGVNVAARLPVDAPLARVS